MPPLFLFLASSFNVELVYVILKGVTQFSYLVCNNGDCSKTNAKAAKLELFKSGPDLTITLHKIKIKDFNKWTDVKVDQMQETGPSRKKSFLDLPKLDEDFVPEDDDVLIINK